MLQDIFDRDGNLISCVETVRSEIKYGDGHGHVVETIVNDDLRYSDFSGKNLENADFHCMNLFAANFSHANLKNADFRDVVATIANFYEAVLEGADFRGADLSGTTLKKEDLEGVAIFDERTEFHKHFPPKRPSWL